jgi:hypothetical protein
MHVLYGGEPCEQLLNLVHDDGFTEVIPYDDGSQISIEVATHGDYEFYFSLVDYPDTVSIT